MIMDIMVRLANKEGEWSRLPPRFRPDSSALDLLRDARVEIERLRAENRSFRERMNQMQWKLDRAEGRIVTTANPLGPDETFSL